MKRFKNINFVFIIVILVLTCGLVYSFNQKNGKEEFFEGNESFSMTVDKEHFTFVDAELEKQLRGGIPYNAALENTNQKGLYTYNIYSLLKKRGVDFSDIVVEFEVIDRQALYDKEYGYLWLTYKYKIIEKSTEKIVTASEISQRYAIKGDENGYELVGITDVYPDSSSFIGIKK